MRIGKNQITDNSRGGDWSTQSHLILFKHAFLTGTVLQIVSFDHKFINILKLRSNAKSETTYCRG